MICNSRFIYSPFDLTLHPVTPLTSNLYRKGYFLAFDDPSIGTYLLVGGLVFLNKHDYSSSYSTRTTLMPFDSPSGHTLAIPFLTG
jgi:hypothetical protein